MASWGPKGPGVGIRAGSNPQQESHAIPTDAHVWGKTDSPKYVEHKTLRAAVSRGT